MVLAEADMLDDDRVPAIVSWFERETADLPPSIAKELGVWFDVQRNGSARTPRCRPRTESTTRLHTRWMLPAVRAWSADGHHSLREISKEDVLLALPPGGNERVLAAKALRTLFSVLKARGLVFVNPTAAIPTGRHERRQPLPLDVQVLRASLDSGDPVRAALTALVAFHGLRAGELRGLKLTDASSGHLYVSTRRIVLADPVRVRLSSYLDYRNAKVAVHGQSPLLCQPPHRVSHGPGRQPLAQPQAGHARTAHPRGPHPRRGVGHRRRPSSSVRSLWDRHRCRGPLLRRRRSRQHRRSSDGTSHPVRVVHCLPPPLDRPKFGDRGS